MSNIQFNGFSPETFRFLKDLEQNNYKEWFDERKNIYEKELLNPLKYLFNTLYPAMYAIDPAFESRPHRCISRIYRDTRFSKNKEPYKNFMWMAFQIPVNRETWKDYPGYFIELRAESYTTGLGLFMPKKKVMDSLRDEIKYNAGEFQLMTQQTVLDRGFAIKGDPYKRHLPNDLPDYFQPWIQRKGIWVDKIKPIGNEVFSAAFASQIMEDFKALEWLYNFMKDSIEI